jgi:hypothetical protein
MRSKTVLFSLILACLSPLLAAVPALAFPPLPSSFYGTVEVNGDNVPDGTIVRALIDDQVYAEGRTQTYQGDSVYSLDVPGDDTATAARDGGHEGDTIQFEVGEVLADQTGTWHSGANVELNLAASATGPLATPPPTPSPVPTRTPIPLAQPSATHTTFAQPSPTPVLPVDSGEHGSSNTGPAVAAVVVVIVVAAGGTAWAVHRRR